MQEELKWSSGLGSLGTHARESVSNTWLSGTKSTPKWSFRKEFSSKPQTSFKLRVYLNWESLRHPQAVFGCSNSILGQHHHPYKRFAQLHSILSDTQDLWFLVYVFSDAKTHRYLRSSYCPEAFWRQSSRLLQLTFHCRQLKACCSWAYSRATRGS